MPCIAMGIPVIFISKALYNARFDVLDGIIPVYYHKDIKYIDWNPKPANIDTLKKAIVNNAVAQVLQADNRCDTIAELNNVTQNLKPVEYLPLHMRIIRKIMKKIKKLI